MRNLAQAAFLLTVAATASCASKSSALFTLRADVPVTEVVATIRIDDVEEPQLGATFASLAPKEDGSLGALAIVLDDRAAKVTMIVRAVDPDGQPRVGTATVMVARGARQTATIELSAPALISLTLRAVGPGAGVITGAFGECRGTCTVEVPALLPVTLAATPDINTTFSGWQGGCAPSGSAPECVFVPLESSMIEAGFDGVAYTVTMKTILGAEGSGVVVSTPARLDCGTRCIERFAAGTELTLTPMLGADVEHKWIDATCAGNTGACAFTLDADREISLLAGRVNYAFVTSGIFSTDLGGLAGADAKCRAEAEAANLPGTFVAWLSSGEGAGTPARARIAGARGWIRPDGLPFADDFSNLIPGAMVPIHRIFYPLRITAAGMDVVSEINTSVFTGTDIYGGGEGAAPTWQAAGTAGAIMGDATHGGGRWTLGLLTGGSARLYCLGVDFNGEVVPKIPTTPTRLAFVSQSVSRSGGVPNADLACATGAASLGATGTFVAYFATSSFSAASRFDPNGPPWRRPDGVLLAATARDFLENPAKHLAALNQNYTGAHLNSAMPLTGAATSATLAQVAENCDDLTSGAGAVLIGDATSSSSHYFFDPDATPGACTGNGVVYCLQQ